MHSLDDLFSEHKDTIRQCRMVDATFDEICADIEVLTSELGDLAQLSGDEIVKKETVILESLAGLEQEIRGKLGEVEELGSG